MKINVIVWTYEHAIKSRFRGIFYIRISFPNRIVSLSKSVLTYSYITRRENSFQFPANYLNILFLSSSVEGPCKPTSLLFKNVKDRLEIGENPLGLAIELISWRLLLELAVLKARFLKLSSTSRCWLIILVILFKWEILTQQRLIVGGNCIAVGRQHYLQNHVPISGFQLLEKWEYIVFVALRVNQSNWPDNDDIVAAQLEPPFAPKDVQFNLIIILK